MAEGMDAMANATTNKVAFAVTSRDYLVDHSFLSHPRYGEFARNAVDRYEELQLVVSQLRTLA
jgi:hypothetical protein